MLDRSNRKVIVTGACGFIGSHLVEHLLQEGYQVKAFVQYNAMNSFGWLEALSPVMLKEVEVISGDIRSPFAIKKAMEGCSAVLHLAALIGIPYSYNAPEHYVATNITGTLNILEAAKTLGLQKVIHTSTSEVYGTAKYVPIDESHPLQPQSPYSASKIAADQMALSYYHAFDLPVTILRPFNTFGPRQSARAVIPTVISQITQGKAEIALGALSPTRDFTYVEDTVRAFEKALKAHKIEGKTINLGTNFEISVGDLVLLIAELMHKNVNIRQENQRLRPERSEVERLLSDNTLAKTCIGWEPSMQGREGLIKGLEKTIAWFSHPENQRYYKPEVYNI